MPASAGPRGASAEPQTPAECVERVVDVLRERVVVLLRAAGLRVVPLLRLVVVVLVVSAMSVISPSRVD